jgi:Transposase IS66 family/Family of unknown function (DUF6444)
VLTLDQLGISEEDWNQTPASVRAALMFLIQQNQRLENRCATYELQVQRLQAEMERLKKLELEVAELRERLGQNSQNSSKPPSSDPPSVSRPNKYQPTGRKRGGQRGHQGHGRPLLPPEQVDRIVELRPVNCHQFGLGTVAAIQQQVSNALEQPVKTARQYVHQQPVNHVDETGWPESDKQKWIWINATSEVTVFQIMGRRGKAEAREVIGRGYLGTVNTDRYAAYYWVDAHRRQLCWAHLKREFEAIKERGGASAEIGEGLLREVEELFDLWHELRAGSLSREEFQQRMEPIQVRVRNLLSEGVQCEQVKTRRTCENLLKMEVSLWTFVREQGVEPTNNDAERPLRRAVLWRRKSFGTRSESGSRFVERILTAVTTLRQQGRDVLDYLTAVCTSVNREGGPICLIPDSS